MCQWLRAREKPLGGNHIEGANRVPPAAHLVGVVHELPQVKARLDVEAPVLDVDYLLRDLHLPGGPPDLRRSRQSAGLPGRPAVSRPRYAASCSGRAFASRQAGRVVPSWAIGKTSAAILRSGGTSACLSQKSSRDRLTLTMMMFQAASTSLNFS